MNQQPADNKQQENTEQKTNKREKEFHEAVERVYRRYGNDLSAFYRDVQRELVKRS